MPCICFPKHFFSLKHPCFLVCSLPDLNKLPAHLAIYLCSIVEILALPEHKSPHPHKETHQAADSIAGVDPHCTTDKLMLGEQTCLLSYQDRVCKAFKHKVLSIWTFVGERRLKAGKTESREASVGDGGNNLRKA